MKIQFFSVNALEPAEDQVAIDDFCSRHRVVAIDKKLRTLRKEISDSKKVPAYTLASMNFP